MVVAAFSVIDKANSVEFFKETFLVANISLKVVLKILFLTLSGAIIDFSSWKLRQRTYITKEALLITRYVELVDKKKFAVVALDPKHETYIVHIGSVSSIASPSFFALKLNIHPFHRPQISGLIV